MMQLMSAPQNDPSDQEQISHAYAWLGNEGKLGFEQINDLAASGSPESRESLKQLAEDNNVSIDGDPARAAEELRIAMERNDDDGV